MKPTNYSTGRLVMFMLVAGLTIGLVSWKDQRTGQQQQINNDTVPNKSARDHKVRDLDEALDELNKLDLKETMDKAHAEIEKAMKELDMSKIKLDIEKSMKDIDFSKMEKELKESIGKIDLDKMKKEMESLKEIDFSKMEKELKESLAKIDFDKIKIEMDKVKEIDLSKMESELKKAKEEMENIKPKMQEELEKAKVEVEKAKKELTEFKTFVDGLDSDGLINKKQDYSLRHKDGELFINGKKASSQVYTKYRSFLESHKKFNIEKSGDDFDMDLD